MDVDPDKTISELSKDANLAENQQLTFLDQNDETKSKTQEAVVALEAIDVHKTYRVGKQDVEVLKGISMTVNQGDFMIVFGPSGSGKSTLLHVLLGLEKPEKGVINSLGVDIYGTLDEDGRSEFRKKNIGMVYQQSTWIRSLKVIENVAFPLMLMGQEKKKAFELAIEKLKIFGMENWANYMPTELSSGQQQRVSLARAMITTPRIIIADEPTGNLDNDAGKNLVENLIKLSDEGTTIIMVTHDLEYLTHAKKSVRIQNGEIIGRYDKSSMSSLFREVFMGIGGKGEAIVGLNNKQENHETPDGLVDENGKLDTSKLTLPSDNEAPENQDQPQRENTTPKE